MDKPPTIRGLPQRGSIPLSVVDGLPMPALISRISDDRVVYVNEEFTTAYGHANDAVIGSEVFDLHCDPGDRHETLAAHAAGGSASVEVRLRSALGGCHWAKADISRFLLDGEEDVLLTTFYDIEDRKEFEAQVVDLARFPNMNPGPVLRLDMDATVRRCNPAAEQLFGEDLEGRCFWDACPDLSAEARERALAGGEPMIEDARVGDVWLRLTIAHPPETDQIFVFANDVTSQKRAEEELAERARFPAMNPGAVARVGSDGTVIRANPAASRLFGMESIRGQSWLDLFPGIDGDVWNRARENDGYVQYEAEIGERWYSFTLRHEPVSDQVFVYGSDITELKAAESALAELARFPDMNPGPVCRLDRSGRVLLANPAARAVFGTNDLEGRSWMELVPDLPEDFWDRLVSTGRPTTAEATIARRHFVLTHAPGPEGIFVFVYGSDVTREKEAERALLQSEKMATLGTLAAGVTHELNNPAAAARRAAQQLGECLMKLQRTRTTLMDAVLPADAGHLMTRLDDEARTAAERQCELSTMARGDLEADVEEWLEDHGADAAWELAPILVEGGIGLDRLDDLAEEVGERAAGPAAVWLAQSQHVYRLLDEIRQGTGRISEIVGAMKSYSYLGQAPIQSIDVNEGIRNTLVILRSKLRGGIDVYTELAEDLPAIEAWGSELNQVWTNLLDNAVYAMDGSGEIRIRSMVRDDRVTVEIEDDGPGIPEDIQARVFDAFFTTKPPGSGTGLGLNTTWKIVVEKHGGSIHLDSGPGRTRFRIELPIRRAAPAGAGRAQD